MGKQKRINPHTTNNDVVDVDININISTSISISNINNDNDNDNDTTNNNNNNRKTSAAVHDSDLARKRSQKNKIGRQQKTTKILLMKKAIQDAQD